MRDQRGSAPVVALIVVLPLLMLTVLGFSWFGHMAAVKGVCQEAASAGARYLSFHTGDVSGATSAAQEVIDQAAINGFMPKYSGSSLRIMCRDTVASGGRGVLSWPVRTDNYAQCVVWYDYPIPIRNFWVKNANRSTSAWGGVGSVQNQTVVTLAGEAFYRVEP